MGSRKLLQEVRYILRAPNYSYRTEQSYLYWLRKYILFFQKRHPAEMGETQIKEKR